MLRDLIENSLKKQCQCVNVIAHMNYMFEIHKCICVTHYSALMMVAEYLLPNETGFPRGLCVRHAVRVLGVRRVRVRARAKEKDEKILFKISNNKKSVTFICGNQTSKATMDYKIVAVTSESPVHSVENIKNKEGCILITRFYCICEELTCTFRISHLANERK